MAHRLEGKLTGNGSAAQSFHGDIFLKLARYFGHRVNPFNSNQQQSENRLTNLM